MYLLTLADFQAEVALRAQRQPPRDLREGGDSVWRPPEGSLCPGMHAGVPQIVGSGLGEVGEY